jgi:hypothetical protein
VDIFVFVVSETGKEAHRIEVSSADPRTDFARRVELGKTRWLVKETLLWPRTLYGLFSTLGSGATAVRTRRAIAQQRR